MKKGDVNLVFLPATEPGDKTYGTIPERIAGYPTVVARRVQYPTMVWYNESIRTQAIGQIRLWNDPSVVLVGFSKSGLGAWNIARAIPDRVSATIIFDAPVATDRRPQWRADEFYADDAAWQKDLPIRTTSEFASAMPETHRLILISGANFHDEMRMLSQELLQIGYKHAFLDRSHMKHHWNSGWIEEGLNELLPPTVPRGS